MKRTLFYIAISLLPLSVFSQINWVKDMTIAQALSIEKQKLIVLDFTASWCQPCKRMETELWSSPEMKELSDNFIFLKIDIDIEPIIASNYGIKSIPYVIITNIVGDELWRMIGYRGSIDDYIDVFKQVPTDVAQLNTNLLPSLRNEETTEDLFELGKTYQNLGRDQNNKTLKISFLDLSNKYFKKVKKKDTEQSQEAELRILLNLVYFGKPEKALTKIKKYPENYFTDELTELKNFTTELCLTNSQN